LPGSRKSRQGAVKGRGKGIYKEGSTKKEKRIEKSWIQGKKKLGELTTGSHRPWMEPFRVAGHPSARGKFPPVENAKRLKQK